MQRRRRLPFLVLWAGVVGATVSSGAPAQQPGPGAAKASLTCSLVDDAGAPIVGATIRGWTLDRKPLALDIKPAGNSGALQLSFAQPDPNWIQLEISAPHYFTVHRLFALSAVENCNIRLARERTVAFGSIVISELADSEKVVLDTTIRNVSNRRLELNQLSLQGNWAFASDNPPPIGYLEIDDTVEMVSPPGARASSVPARTTVMVRTGDRPPQRLNVQLKGGISVTADRHQGPVNFNLEIPVLKPLDAGQTWSVRFVIPKALKLRAGAKSRKRVVRTLKIDCDKLKLLARLAGGETAEAEKHSQDEWEQIQ